MTRANCLYSLRNMSLLALTALFAFGAAVAMAGEDPRVSVTTQGLKSAVENGRGHVSRDEVDAGTNTGKRSAKSDATTGVAGQSKATSGASRSANTDFWFYTADVELFSDTDRDGYFSGIDLLFDADTIYASADVYAVVYLSLDGGPWEEYAVTDDFTLFGASSDDEYVIVTELVSGYMTGSYDILIELFDSYDGAFVADFGPEQTSELAYLPLEDADRDAVAPGGSTIVINQGGGGAFGWMLLMGLMTAAAVRRRQA